MDPLTPPDELPLVGPWRDALAELYAQPPRHYHTLDHVRSVAATFHAEEARDPWERPAEVFAAVLFHDAIYVAGRPDNEARSAELAARLLPTWTEAEVDLDRVAALIRRTAAHGGIARDEVDADAARFLDCDMAVLGAPPAEYDAYADGVAREFGFVPRVAYVAGRSRFLRRLLEVDRIFLSNAFHARLDRPARANLRRELAGLSASPGTA